VFSGWIKLHRQSLNTTALKDDARRGMWERILLRAAHTPTKVDWRGQTIVLAPGQCAISVRQFAAEGGQPYKAARGILDRFEREGMIQQMPIRVQGGAQQEL
jgi:hypothetical protein